MRPYYDFSRGERGKFYRRGARLNLPRHEVVPDPDHTNGNSATRSPEPRAGVSRPTDDSMVGNDESGTAAGSRRNAKPTPLNTLVDTLVVTIDGDESSPTVGPRWCRSRMFFIHR